MANVKSLSLVVTLTLLFLIATAMPMTAAMGIDNVKNSKNIPAGGSFNLNGKAIEHNPIWNNYAPIEIKNLLGLGKTLFQGAITQHDDVCGTECSSTMQIYLGEDSVLIDDVNFYTILDDGSRVEQDVRSYQFYVSSLNNNSANTVDDEIYELGTRVSRGTYEVRLAAEKKPSRTVDWVIKTQGETLSEWATWGNISLGDDAEVILNSPVDNYISPTNKVELNCSANVTGGATLTNMSLWTNESGSWVQENIIKFDIYDDFNDASINTSLWTVASGGPVGSVTETGGYMRLYGRARYNNENSFGQAITEEIWDGGETNEFVNIEIPLIKFVKTAGGGTSCQASAQFGSTNMLVYTSCESQEYNNYKVQVNKNSTGFFYRTYNGSWSGFTSLGSTPENITFRASGVSSGGTDHYTTIEMRIDEVNKIIGEITDFTIYETINFTAESMITSKQITGPIDWTCSAGDSDGDTGFAPENRTVLLDTSPPSINITYPVTSFDYAYLGQNFSLNWTVSDTNLYQCWYNYNNTNTTVTCTDKNTSFILTDQKNITFYANDSVENEGNFTRSWTYKIFENSETYNSTTYETTADGFKINLTSDGTQLVLADLIYNGIAYTTTKVGNNSEMEFNRNLIIPELDIATAQNRSFYWNVTYGSEVIQTESNNQSVERIALGLCNATLTVPYINFTFEDEEIFISTNATIDTSTWNYYLASGDGSANKTLLYSTTTLNDSYKFCFTPSDRELTSSLELQYSGTGYPQRRWSTSGSLTNLTSNPLLYMLASADGTYSVYQVQNTVGSGIPGVEVEAERQFDGVWTLVEQGVTDSAGGFTGWLNPDYDHRLTFTKSGYTTVQVTVRPSSSTYTVVMSGEAGEAVYNSSEEGMTWVVYPDLGKIIFPNTTQIFSFNITANYSNLVACKMEIVNNDSVSLGTTTGCNSYGGNLSLSIPLGENRSVRAIYSVNIGEGFFILDSDAYWILMVVNIPDRGTLTSFFTHLRDLNEFGSDNNRQEYSRIVFFYLILAIVMASISRATNWDLINIGGSLVFMNFIIIFGSYAGFLTLSYTGVNGWMDQYVVALITSLFTVGFIFNKLEGRV